MNDTRILIHYRYLPQAGELPPEDHHAFLLEDVDAACERMVEQGLTLEVPARDFPWGRSAYVRDPDGRHIEITQKGSEPLEGDSSHAG